MSGVVNSSSYPDMIADEDMAFLLMICKNLAEKHHSYRLNLQDGAYLTNKEPDDQNFSFAGIDAIKDMHDKLSIMDGNSPHRLIMPSDTVKVRTHIGTLYKMEVFIDPVCPKDKFIIEQDHNVTEEAK